MIRVVARMPAKAYEFPTGYSAVFGAERYQVGEHMFFNNPQNASQPKIIMALVSDALRTCDPELRGVLASNVVLTGGGSLLTGVLDRLNMELGRMGFAHVRTALSSSPRQVPLANPVDVLTHRQRSTLQETPSSGDTEAGSAAASSPVSELSTNSGSARKNGR